MKSRRQPTAPPRRFFSFWVLTLGFLLVAAQLAQVRHIHADHNCKESYSFANFSNESEIEALEIGSSHSHENQEAGLFSVCALCMAGNLSFQASHPASKLILEFKYFDLELNTQFYQKRTAKLYQLHPKTSPPVYI